MNSPSTNGRPIIAALNKVLQSEFIQYRSHLWIVTDGYPNDSDRFTIALDAAAKRHAYVSLQQSIECDGYELCSKSQAKLFSFQINFLIIGDTTGPGGITNYNDTRVLSCLTLSQQTGGQYYQVRNFHRTACSG